MEERTVDKKRWKTKQKNRKQAKESKNNNNTNKNIEVRDIINTNKRIRLKIDVMNIAKKYNTVNCNTFCDALRPDFAMCFGYDSTKILSFTCNDRT